jgi:pyruvate formate lyase activating enzyme
VRTRAGRPSFEWDTPVRCGSVDREAVAEMTEQVVAPDVLSLADPHTVPTSYWHSLPDGRVQCDVCPRACKLREGQRGLCFVRGRIEDQIVLATYGRSSGFCIDPVEKKPLNHFLPGSAVLSFGTAGCNLACRFCQNWDISKSREIDTLSDAASPETLARAAERVGARSVAFTYNDPVIFMEYAMDVADACRERGIKAIAVSAGYINAEPRAEFYRHMDAANIDLKAFTDAFYEKITFARLPAVLDTLAYLRHQTDVWFEITTLLIPGHNDSDGEIAEECAWLVEHLGPDVPLHFSAFHPDFKMRDVPPTPPDTLRRARRIALEHGLRYVYTGNVHDPDGGTTRCPGCGRPVVVRDWYDIVDYRLTGDGACADCGTRLPGVYDGPVGGWGRRRMPIRLVDSSGSGDGPRDRRAAAASTATTPSA